jgi:hypothetical protein
MRWGLLGALVATISLGFAAMTLAVHDLGLFELDANTVGAASGANSAGDDWTDLYGTDGTDGASTVSTKFDGFSFVADGLGTTGDTTYWTGGGSKDRNDISQWQWSANDQSPDKNDIENAFAAAYHDGTPTKHYLYFGADRFTVNGDAQMGFWFLKNPVCLSGVTTGDLVCPSSNPGKFLDPETGDVAHHSDGDILAIVNFNNGGAIGLAAVYEWTGGVGGAPVQKLLGTGADCKSIAGPDDFCTTSNTGDLTGEPVWAYDSKKSGKTIHYYQTSAFIEGGINLSSIAGAGTCFPTFIAETRSSSGPSTGLSLDAQLKDLAFGQFQSCGATISTTPKLSDGTTTVPASGTSITTAGSIQVKDSASLVVTGTETWSGTLKFFLCGPISSPTTCASGGAQIGAAAGLAVSNTTTQPIVSAAATVTSAGRYCWRAEFDSSTSGVPDKSDSSANECFVVNPVAPTLTTTASNGTAATGASPGTALDDTANLSGTANKPGSLGPNATYPTINPTVAGGVATGTITFRLYGPSDTPVCTDPATGVTGNLVGSSVVNVSGDSSATTIYRAGNGSVTGSLSPTTPGTYYWRASYSGDSPNTLPGPKDSNNAAIFTPCGDTNESSFVRQIPTQIKTKQSWYPNDTATVSSTIAGDNLAAGGTLDFFLYNNATCTAGASNVNVKYTERRVLTGGANSEELSTRNYPGSGASAVPTFTWSAFAISTNYADAAGSSSGSYSWKVVYTPASSDTAHTGKQSSCGELFSVTFTNDNGPGTDLP